ncbi:Heat shock cognate 71 kDa protein [Heterocephalus glaber]|uniref:Heat shock cognate 71 kDa protein n=1 Tax=Heterocephalus glaber TaxID=10181 RepID=G5BWP2_HETGA|nr:Heat shock cognate 71 kDa protein [Heterocephalus glaber]
MPPSQSGQDFSECRAPHMEATFDADASRTRDISVVDKRTGKGKKTAVAETRATWTRKTVSVRLGKLEGLEPEMRSRGAGIEQELLKSYSFNTKPITEDEKLQRKSSNEEKQPLDRPPGKLVEG